MTVYYVSRFCEVIITIIGGWYLMTRGEELRWKNWLAKACLIITMLTLTGLMIWNAVLFTFSVLEHYFIIAWFVICMAIFYSMKFLYIIVWNLLYWQNLMLMRFVVLCYCSTRMEQSADYYARDMTAVHLVHIIHIYVVIFFTIWLCNRAKKKPLMKFLQQKEYVILTILLMLEGTIINYLFVNERVASVLEQDSFIILLFLIMMVTGISILFLMYRAHKDKNQQTEILQMKHNMLEEQYHYAEEKHQEKRKLIHDSRQQYELLKHYLTEGNILEASCYLEEMQQNMKRNIKEVYVSDPDVAFIINYKVEEAGNYGIKVKTDLDLYRCPIKRDDFCILTGNLMDNAIEAVKELPDVNKNIHVKMKSTNQMFYMEICNDYEGKRRKHRGIYQTTKKDKGDHGLGLESCKQIVADYQGDFTIEDNGNNFRVGIMIYHSRT